MGQAIIIAFQESRSPPKSFIGMMPWADCHLITKLSLLKLIGVKYDVICFWLRTRESSMLFWDALMIIATVALIVTVFHVLISLIR